MGTFSVDVLVAASHAPDRRAPLNLLVDSGSVYSWISAAVLERLGIRPFARRRVMAIDGERFERAMAEVVMTLAGQTLHTLCLVGLEGDLQVLGAYTLEGFGLGVDPVQRRLVPVIQYGAGVALSTAVAVGTGSTRITQ